MISHFSRLSSYGWDIKFSCKIVIVAFCCKETYSLLPRPHPHIPTRDRPIRSNDEHVPAVRRGAGRGAVPRAGQRQGVAGVAGDGGARQACGHPTCPPTPKFNTGGGWQGWVHWLGSSDLKPPPFLPFDEALAVAQSLGLASSREWEVWCKEGMRPPNVPSDPPKFHKDNGWQGWVHWLGSSNIEKPSKFAPFGQALTFAQSLNLANRTEWHQWCKGGTRPPNMPSNPDKTHKDGGWRGWGHWLGAGNQAEKAMQFLPFGEALAVA